MTRRVAIVGLACRLPGGLNGPELLWSALESGTDATSPIPASRWDMQRFYSPDEAAAGKMYVQRGGFVDWDITRFDAAFFGIAPREAEYFDPQQRLLLEVGWEALENSGIDPTALAGENVGVYVGGFTLDHMLNQLSAEGRGTIGAHSAAGSTMTMLANRLSYALDLRGPSFTLDTACSSSLVAFHYGCRDVATGVVDLALVGGVNVMLRPEYPIAMSKGHFLARDGRSKSFDARADGYGRAEGAGVVVIKPLELALADGDPILAIVDGSGVNQDGRTPGITVPSAEAQRSLMERVTREAGIDPASVDYVEAHGTGTPVGDPIEASAISAVYGQQRETPCFIGSIKSNTGHLEAAAGVAGLIKATLMLEHGQIPPICKLGDTNPDIPFGRNGLEPARELRALAADGKTPRIAINSFGYGGTNAHAILSGPPRGALLEDEGVQASPERPLLLPISARDPQALRELAAHYLELLRDPGVSLRDLLYSASRRRAHLSLRIAVWGDRREELAEALAAFLEGRDCDALAAGEQPFGGSRKPVFVLTGMGPQWWGMGQELYRSSPAYRDAVEQADAVFQRIAGFSVLDEMLKDEASSRIQRTEYAQPANFVLQCGLLAVLRAAGVEPGAVVGHSVGEVSSAYASGALSLEDAVAVSFQRSRAQAKAAGTGGMLAVGVPLERARALIAGHEDQVSIAAVNGATSITLAGDEALLDEIAKELGSEGAFCRRLAVEVPYHSPMMEALKPELRASLAGLAPRTPSLPLYSTVTGKRVEGIAYDAEYWCDNVRNPVYFAAAIESLLADGYTAFIEVGPHPVLKSSLQELLGASRGGASQGFTLRRGAPELARMRAAAAELHAQGAQLDFALRCPRGRWLVLPNYPWQRQPLWREPERMQRDRVASVAAPLLGLREPGAPRWTVDLGDHRLGFLHDHVVSGGPIMPAAAYLEAFLQAAAAAHPGAAARVLGEVRFERALQLAPDRSLRLEIRGDTELRQFALWSSDAEQPAAAVRHASARLHVLAASEARPLALVDEPGEAIDPAALYARLKQISLEYGPAFQPIRELRVDARARQVSARLVLPESLHESLSSYAMHPSLLDGCFQSALALLAPEQGTYLPTHIGELRLHAPLPAEIRCRARLTRASAREIEVDLEIGAADGALLCEIRALRCTSVGGAREQGVPGGVYRYAWQPCEREVGVPLGRVRVLDAGESPLGRALTGALRSEGVAVQLESWASAGPERLCGSTAGTDAFVLVLAAERGADRADPIGIARAEQLLTWTQRLAALDGAPAPRLYVVTAGAFELPGDGAPPAPSQASAAGMRRVAFNELAALRCSLIDLPAAERAESAAALAGELALEITSNSTDDEVALRTHGRYVSVLERSDVLAAPRTVTLPPERGRRFRAERREAALGWVEDPRVARAPHGAFELELECIGFPGASLQQAVDAAGAERPMLAVVGRVTHTDPAIDGPDAGDRVYGLAPAGVASHAVLDPRRCVLVRAPEKLDARALIGEAVPRALAAALIERACIAAGTRALVCSAGFGAHVAEAIRRRGGAVTLMPGSPDTWTLGQLDGAVAAACAEGGFDVIAAPLADWERCFGLRALARGGIAIDLGATGGSLRVEPHVAEVLRSDLSEPALLAAVELPGALRDALAPLPRLRADELPGCDAAQLAELGVPPAWLGFGHERPLDAVSADLPPIRAEASYLITGGFGGLGRATALWLAQQGAGRIVLSSRRAPDSDEQREFLEQLRALGAAAEGAACDVADRGALEKLLEHSDASGFPLRGVFHTAGVLKDGRITEQSAEDLRQVMVPKALGAWHLHELTQDRPLELFVLFSSFSALVGNSRQANYCAANAFLDALAGYRRGLGLPALSVNWGAIADVGMLQQDAKIGEHLTQIGLMPLGSGRAIAGMASALARGVAQLSIAEDPNWASWSRFETHGATSHRFAALVAAAVASQDRSILGRLKARLLELEESDRVDALTLLMAEVFAAELKMSAEALGADRPLDTLGVDSLMVLGIQRALEARLGLQVSPLDLVSHKTVSDLAAEAWLRLQ